MHITAQEIATLVDGSLEGIPAGPLTGAAGLEEAGPEDVSFLGNLKYLKRIGSSRAGIIFIPETLDGYGRPVIKVKNPQLAFARILALIEKERAAVIPRGVHPTAIIGDNVTLGANVAIGPYVVIDPGAEIGSDTTIMAHCYIGRSAVVGGQSLIYPNVTIRELVQVGSRAIIHSGTVIGSDGFGFIPGRGGHIKIPQIGTVIIGDDVEIGANCAIDRATTGATTIGKGTKLDNLIHIAHNLMIGEHCFIAGQTGFAGSAHVGNYVSFGGQSGAVGHITIGDGATVAGRAGVIGDVAPGETVSGFPARPHREAMKNEVLIRKLPEIYAWFKKAKKSDAGL